MAEKPKHWSAMSRGERYAARVALELAVERHMAALATDISKHLAERGVPFALKITADLEPLEKA